MAIETICSGCSKKLRVAEEHAGKKARCPECGAIYTVPQAAGASSLSSFDRPMQEQPAASPSTRSFANPPAKDSERWFMKIEDGREFGPIERTTLDQWYAERRIGPTTQLKREFDAFWQSAPNVYPALAQSAPAFSGPPSVGANPFAEAPAFNPYASPGIVAAPRAYAEPHRGVLILILGIAGWVVGCFIIGLIAWALGAQDLAKMKSGQMDPSGEGLTRAGMIIGAIFGVLQLLLTGLVVLMLCAGAAAGN